MPVIKKIIFFFIIKKKCLASDRIHQPLVNPRCATLEKRPVVAAGVT